MELYNGIEYYYKLNGCKEGFIKQDYVTEKIDDLDDICYDHNMINGRHHGCEICIDNKNELIYIYKLNGIRFGIRAYNNQNYTVYKQFEKLEIQLYKNEFVIIIDSVCTQYDCNTKISTVIPLKYKNLIDKYMDIIRESVGNDKLIEYY